MSVLSTKMLQAAAGASPKGAWDLSYAYYDPPEGLAFDLSTASYVNKSFNVNSQHTNPRGLAFKPDGTKMYVVGVSADVVSEYDLSTAWDVSTASYLQNFSVALQETTPNGLFFKPDGTKMYIVGSTGDDVNEYDLSTAWDISTASYLQNFSVSAQETAPVDLAFGGDGTKMYILGAAGLDVNEYTLSTAWDVSTASYVQNFSVGTQESNPQGLSFSYDGTKMYVVGISSDAVFEYTLSTAWDVSTASYIQSFSVAQQDANPIGIFFNPYGGYFYIIGLSSGDVIFQYTVGEFYVGGQERTPTGIFFKPDGLKMYISGVSGDDVNEYNLSTAWDISTATYSTRFSVLSQASQVEDLFFKPDGTTMYIVCSLNNAVYEYSLSTAWVVSSASYIRNFSVAAQGSFPTCLSFKSDGTKMYVAGSNSDAVHEYNLSTAWNISTASYAQSFSVAVQEANPKGMFFKPDGTKMYVAGDAGDDVNEYSLSTAWDVSSASYVQNFSIVVQVSIPMGIFFKDDGTQMFIVNNARDCVVSYTLGVQE